MEGSTKERARPARAFDAWNVWAKFGLVRPPFFGLRRIRPPSDTLSRASRLRLAFQELGGLYLLFAEFLAGRADRLPSAYLSELDQMPPSPGPAGSPAASEAALDPLRHRLLSIEPLETTLHRSLARAFFQGRPVMLEIYDIPSEREREVTWNRFVRGIRRLSDGPEASITEHRFLEQFRQWYGLTLDVERKRRILRALEPGPAGCVTQFPRPVQELDSENVLAYEWLEGSSLNFQPPAPEVAGGDLTLLAESAFELPLLFGVVPAQTRPADLIVTRAGRLGFQRLPTLLPIPGDRHFELLQYVASTLAGDSGRAVHMLCRLVQTRNPSLREDDLWKELAGIPVDLHSGIHLVPSLSAFRNFWMALQKTGSSAPLFLDLFHRRLLLLGKETAAVGNGDVPSEAIWPVLARLIRLRVSETLTGDSLRDWLIGGGLVALGVGRQMNVVLERLRELDLSVTISVSQRERRRRGNLPGLLAAGAALIAFILAIRSGLADGDPAWMVIKTLVAVAAAVVVWFNLARME